MTKNMISAGIANLGTLREVLRGDFWTRDVPGIGDESGKKIVHSMFCVGLIDEDFEAWKETYDKEYRTRKMIRLREEADKEEGC